MQRHLSLLRQLLTYHPPGPPLSAEELLDQAKHHMKKLHAHSRERAVAVISHKNNLRTQVESLEARVDELEVKAVYAEPEVALTFRKEKQSYETTLNSLREALVEAEDAAEQVKLVIKREEELIREKTALDEELKDAGLWVGGPPRGPQLDLKTARELVVFLLIAVAVLLVALMRR